MTEQRKEFYFKVPENLKHLVKKLAEEKACTNQEIVSEALERYLNNYNKDIVYIPIPKSLYDRMDRNYGR